MDLTTRIHFRRFARPVWEDVLSHTACFELELDDAKSLRAVLQLLRRFRRDHGDAFFVVTVLESCLLRIDRLVERPTNAMTGKPCDIRVETNRPVDEYGLVEALAQVAETFHQSVSRKAFHACLAEQFTAHVLRHRRALRQLGLDHAAMVALAEGMFQRSIESLEEQALRVLGR